MEGTAVDTITKGTGWKTESMAQVLSGSGVSAIVRRLQCPASGFTRTTSAYARAQYVYSQCGVLGSKESVGDVKSQKSRGWS